MKPFVLLTALLAVTLTSTFMADASSIRLDQVVRALDALYKRQGGGTSPAATTEGPAPTTDGPTTAKSVHTSGWSSWEAYSGGSSEGSGTYGSGSGEEGVCPGPRKIVGEIREVFDRLFIKSIREASGDFNSVCIDLFEWLDVHDAEEEMADESSGMDSSMMGSTAAPTPVAKKRNMGSVKRSLRSLKKRMEMRSGSDEGSYSYSSEEENYNDGDIKWHRLFLSCYVWVHLSDADVWL